MDIEHQKNDGLNSSDHHEHDMMDMNHHEVDENEIIQNHVEIWRKQKLVLNAVLIGLLLIVGAISLGVVLNEKIPQKQLNNFRQDLSQRYTYNGRQISVWKQLPIKDTVISVKRSFTKKEYFYAQTEGQLWRMNATSPELGERLDERYGLEMTKNSKMSVSSNGYVAISTNNKIYKCSEYTDTCQIYTLDTTDILALAYSHNQNDLYIGTDRGIGFIKNDTSVVEWDSETANTPITQIADSIDALIGVSEKKIFRYIKIEKRWHYFFVPGVIDATPVAVIFDRSNKLWMGNEMSVTTQDEDGTLKRIGGRQGLITRNITSISQDTITGLIWIGSLRGVTSYNPFTTQKSYYYGPRYLPGTTEEDFEVNSVEVLEPINYNDTKVVVATKGGLAVIYYEPFTLQKKAEYFEESISFYHREVGSGESHGYLIGDCILKDFGDNTTCTPAANHEGVWTSLYLASQCFKYAIFKNATIKKHAWKYFTGMTFLNKVTGKVGLVASSVLPNDFSPLPEGTWHNSTTFPNFVWKSGATDEDVLSHLFVYPLVLHFLAETNEEKIVVKDYIVELTDHIVSNGLKFIDIDGQPSETGFWDAKSLNDQSNFAVRGVRSMQIVSILLSAYQLTNNAKYLGLFNELVEKFDYDYNLENAKISNPLYSSFEHDQSLFLSYFLYIFNPTKEKFHFKCSIERSFKILSNTNNSLYNIIYATTKFHPDFSISDAINTLKQFPLETIDWPFDNTQRLDVVLDNFGGFDNQSMSVNLLNYQEHSYLRFTQNPFLLKGGTGYVQSDPGAFLLPYYMAEYYYPGVIDKKINVI